MKYQLKIFIITLVILISTLLLNSVLSLASFEKIYVSSLMSTFEAVGQTIKRKIEQSLKFGKPLDKFQGMDILLGHVIEKNPLITQVVVLDPKHTLLYKSASKSIEKKIPYTNPPMTENGKESYTKLYKGYYYTYLPLLDGKKQTVGYVNLIYSRNVVFDKLATMATENLKVLWVLMLITSTSLILFLAMLISRPIRKETNSIKNILTWPMHDRTADAHDSNDKNEFYSDDMNGKNDAEIIHLPDLSRVKTKFDYVNVDKIKNELEILEYNSMVYVDDTYNALKQIPNVERLRNDIRNGLSRLIILEKQLDDLLEKDIVDPQYVDDIDGIRKKIEFLHNELEPIIEKTIFE